MNHNSMNNESSLLLSRRELLQASLGGFGYTAFSALSTWAAEKEAATAKEPGTALKPPHFPPRAKRVIMLFMQGGVSHLDTFDYKLKLQADHGKQLAADKPAKLLASPWKFAQHGESGQWVSELFPHVARHVDDLCILSGLHTDAQAHETAVPMFHTGNSLQVRPSLGAWVLYGLDSECRDLPGFLALNRLNQFGQNHGCGFLPATYQATHIRSEAQGDEPPIPNLATTHLTDPQQRAQLELIARMNRRRLAHDKVNSELEAVIYSYEMAAKMQTTVPSLMDLSNESAATLKMYGLDGGGASKETGFARQCLLARRFAEAGVRFIEIGVGGWDHHKDLSDLLSASAKQVDQPIAALLADLKQRDLLKDTLVLWAGEFGRTAFAQFDNGRDHNNRGFTIWMAGGGVKSGFRHGVTDDYGGEAVEGRVHIHDLHATMLHLLGLDHERLTYRYSGRDFRLTDVHGHVVKEIIA
jgi:hypothetical protein